MLVYGDHQFTAKLHTLCAELRTLAGRAEQHPHDLDLLRRLLIACGEVEQGAHDALDSALPDREAAPTIASLHAATAHAAEAFYCLACHQPLSLPPPRTEVQTALAHLQECLDVLLLASDVTISVKLPEGFNLHALYPEQYAVAAGRWLADHLTQCRVRSQAESLPVVVVGVRSIGTTLAAVVAAALRAGGLAVDSFTVRPSGHPYARTLDLGPRSFDAATFALVVDEGPGISGSSMAATADALVKRGVMPQRIAFLPGHANDPGGAGSEDVQRWWRTAPRYAASSEDVTFGGLSLLEALAAALPEPCTEVENFSGGVWRRHLYAEPGAWPPVCNYFERVKYRFTLRSGRQVLYKFLGLAAGSPSLATTSQAAADVLATRAARGLGAPVAAQALGFIATEWLPGTPLPSHEGYPRMPQLLGTYIARTAGPSLAAEELASATARLTEMIYVNVGEALGAGAVAVARNCRPSSNCPRCTYGDGHLRPHEWLASGAQPLRKVDTIGHDCDHTLVGKQPVAWDVAGAMIEWRLDDAAAACLLQAYAAAGGPHLDAATLHFYRLAYAALRAGQCALAAAVHDPYEKDRLLKAYAGYRQQLAAILTAHT